jgi:hypothetical protein
VPDLRQVIPVHSEDAYAVGRAQQLTDHLCPGERRTDGTNVIACLLQHAQESFALINSPVVAALAVGASVQAV